MSHHFGLYFVLCHLVVICHFVAFDPSAIMLVLLLIFPTSFDWKYVICLMFASLCSSFDDYRALNYRALDYRALDYRALDYRAASPVCVSCLWIIVLGVRYLFDVHIPLK